MDNHLVVMFLVTDCHWYNITPLSLSRVTLQYITSLSHISVLVHMSQHPSTLMFPSSSHQMLVLYDELSATQISYQHLLFVLTPAIALQLHCSSISNRFPWSPSVSIEGFLMVHKPGNRMARLQKKSDHPLGSIYCFSFNYDFTAILKPGTREQCMKGLELLFLNCTHFFKNKSNMMFMIVLFSDFLVL